MKRRMDVCVWGGCLLPPPLGGDMMSVRAALDCSLDDTPMIPQTPHRQAQGSLRQVRQHLGGGESQALRNGPRRVIARALSPSTPVAHSQPTGGGGASPPPPAPHLAHLEQTKPHCSPPSSSPSQIVMRDRVTGKPRGFGFVTFDDEASARGACADAHLLDGRAVRPHKGERGREAGGRTRPKRN